MRYISSTRDRSIAFLLLIALNFACRKEVNTVNPKPTPSSSTAEINLSVAATVLSQTRTATYLNNLNNFRQVYGDQNYPQATAADVAADDGIYANTNKLTAVRDPAKAGRRSISSLALQGFGFTIPDNATIENISVRVRRFKKGTATTQDYILTLMQSYSGNPTNGISDYGFMWRFGDVYPGSNYPDTETEYVFSQSGSGNDGQYTHDQLYQWTPAIVNATYFGVRIDNYPPIGRGTVVIYYDLVEVTVGYSLPTP